MIIRNKRVEGISFSGSYKKSKYYKSMITITPTEHLKCQSEFREKVIKRDEKKKFYYILMNVTLYY